VVKLQTMAKIRREFTAFPSHLWLLRSKGSVRLRVTNLKPQKVAAIMVGAYTNEVTMQQLVEDVEVAYKELNSR
jgi:triosephosphate isomerase